MVVRLRGGTLDAESMGHLLRCSYTSRTLMEGPESQVVGGWGIAGWL
jgi:hypothetical protein